jgi:hypothetical protein
MILEEDEGSGGGRDRLEVEDELMVQKEELRWDLE